MTVIPASFASTITEAGAPARFNLGVECKDDQGKSYSDSFELDLDVIAAISPAPSEGLSASGSDQELANIERALRTLNVHVGELRR